MIRNRRVLIADDDPDDLMLFQEAIRDIDDGIECYAYSSCENALRAMNKKEIPLPDFIFLDINMPRINGIDCLKELKKNADLKNIPVIMYSTTSNPKDVQYTLELGAVYFLKKPSNLEKLYEELNYVLQMAF